MNKDDKVSQSTQKMVQNISVGFLTNNGNKYDPN